VPYQIRDYLYAVLQGVYKLDCPHSRSHRSLNNIFLPVTLKFDLDLRMWPRQCQGETGSQTSSSKAI